MKDPVVKGRGVLLYNGAAGRGPADRFERVIARMKEMGLGFEIKEIAGDTQPGDVAEDALAGKPAWLAVAGGDGTVEAVASRMIDASTPLAIIPMGTYNNFARSLSLPLDPVKACEILTEGAARPVDCGLANGKVFFEAAGIGLDAALFPFGEEIKRGRVALWIDLFRRAFRYPRRLFRIDLDGPACEVLCRTTANESRQLVRRVCRHSESSISFEALMVTVSNGPYYGMSFTVAPQQRMDDGRLTISVFHRYSKMELWWHFLSVAFGRREYSPKSIAFRVRTAKISGPRESHVHLDGTPRDLWPVEVECKRNALQVFRSE